MARGWESKSVEDQMAEAERRTGARPRRELTPEEQAREAKRMTLQLSRTRILQDLQTACHPHHRAMLERSLAFVDQELQALG